MIYDHLVQRSRPAAESRSIKPTMKYAFAAVQASGVGRAAKAEAVAIMSATK